ncbi:hypothetical protein HW090_15750 [Pseudomonas sp. ABC1]|uniref:PA3371 family protein n=1 Tax=Pseudomonas sp. ABC1 TaxID=2748080 RepID=UPI0015C35618|nr:PA3371 family protein [Pseudomonas sp. ABC1]QLF94571.1 hypothetical protein HW090_15750 [Pseudomonas sp. ABC1]
MSRLAMTLLILTAGFALAASFAPETSGAWKIIGQIGAGISGTGFLIALLAGRKIKFDPVLR